MKAQVSGSGVSGQLWSLVLQIILLATIAGGVWFLVVTTLANLQVRGIQTGFAFLLRPINMPIAHSWLEFTPGLHTYLRAVIVGFLNTLSVSFVVIAISTLAGTVIGIARLSPNWLLSRSCAVYVEIVRNVPVLLQLVFWYQLLLQLPPPRSAIAVADGVFLSNRGLRYPGLTGLDSLAPVAIAFMVGAVLLIALPIARRRVGDNALRTIPLKALALLLLVVVPAAVAWIVGASLSLDMPELRGFNFNGGSSLAPELFALVLGLSTYASAFVAEIVRAGIMGVPKGQREAAEAVGLSRVQVMRKVILPQALRIIVPPLTSEYLGITKNSSLAIAVGYPDLVAIVNTMISDTGQAVEGIAIIMLAFLTISLSVSALMSWYDRSVALVTR